MAEFLTGKNLNEFIYDVIWKAEDRLLIVSPFIKLDDYFKKIFENHKHNHKLEIIIVFGKNEVAPNKSFREVDFEFFKQFKNVAIVYCSNLHAKYYGNEKGGVITSINLYDKSFENNVEFGVAYTVDFLDQFQKSVDTQAWEYSHELISNSPLVYLKRPVYEKGLLTALTGERKYIDTEVLFDATKEISQGYKWEKSTKHYLKDFPEFVDMDNRKKERPAKPEPQEQKQNEDNEIKKWLPKTDQSYPKAEKKPFKQNYTPYNQNNQTGYCIRTGVEIPFDLKKPMSYNAYRTWAEFENPDYPENFCHKTGKPSNGKTSMRRPILYNN